MNANVTGQRTKRWFDNFLVRNKEEGKSMHRCTVEATPTPIVAVVARKRRKVELVGP